MSETISEPSIVITRALVDKLLDTVDAGLVKGQGTPTPGHMCVEAAVCYALGLPHGDDPKCVGRAVRAFKIALNDKRWSSDQARAKGLRRLAVAQLGSDALDQVEFVRRLSYLTITELLADHLERRGYSDHAQACRSAKDLKEARRAARNAAAYAADAAAAYAAYAAAAYAADAADAAYAADADSVLAQSAEIAVRVLVEMESPGAAWIPSSCPA